MRRALAGLHATWIRLFVLSVVAFSVIVEVPMVVGLGVPIGLLALAFVRVPRQPARQPIEVAAPVRGSWVAVNSPGTRVPSHGAYLYGQAYAIDILRSHGAATSSKISWSPRFRHPRRFPTFGAPVHAVADGRVVTAYRCQRDHWDRATWPALIYLFTVEALGRELGGQPFVFGNHVVIDHGGGIYSAYAHLRRGSVRVRRGDRVSAGQQLGEVGNSGNASEPHLHFQLMDNPRPAAAAGVPFRWTGIDLHPDGTIPAYATGPVTDTAVPGLPSNGQVFTAEPTPPR